MQYNGDLKNRVISKFNNATKQINSCKSAKIKIPSEFEGTRTINSALTKIKAVNVDSIKGEFERIATEAEATEAKALQNAFGFGFVGYDVIQKLQHNNLQSKKYEILKMRIEIDVTHMKGELYNYANNNLTDLDDEVKKEVLNQIDGINFESVVKSRVSLKEYKKQYLNAINNVCVYVSRQRQQINDLYGEISAEEIERETQNVTEYLKNIRETSTHIKNGKIYLNYNGHLTKLTPEIFLEAVKNTQNYIYENSSSHGGNFRYGHSTTSQPGQLQDTDTDRKCSPWI